MLMSKIFQEETAWSVLKALKLVNVYNKMIARFWSLWGNKNIEHKSEKKKPHTSEIVCAKC